MLIESSHTLVGSMVAKAVLKAEQKAYDRAVSEGKIEADPKHRWTSEDLEALKHAAFAASAVFVGTTPGQGSNAFAVQLAQRPELPGVCAGIAEGVTMTAMTRAHRQHGFQLGAAARGVTGERARDRDGGGHQQSICQYTSQSFCVNSAFGKALCRGHPW